MKMSEAGVSKPRDSAYQKQYYKPSAHVTEGYLGGV